MGAEMEKTTGNINISLFGTTPERNMEIENHIRNLLSKSLIGIEQYTI